MQSPAVEHEPQSFDKVVSSMCTEPHPAAREAAERFLATNPGDPATYERVAELERTVIADLARLADHPAFEAGSDGDHATADRYGYVTSGGTEANVQAVRAARDRHTRDSHGSTSEFNIVVPSSAHFSFQKAASVLDVELREVPTHPIDGDPERAGRVDLDALRAAVDDQTAVVVAVAGSTAYGRVDPVPAVARSPRRSTPRSTSTPRGVGSTSRSPTTTGRSQTRASTRSRSTRTSWGRRPSPPAG
ncbi:MAG: pyridoxal-dependent decarboxylase [halophilic archaeon J07HB67]|jgi:Glutamate decarboxylase and related PLP-dependent proteins|nr:MAG: pyridoxal-dependent decarboxylase [halophilic archaeon J07HB67]